SFIWCRVAGVGLILCGGILSLFIVIKKRHVLEKFIQNVFIKDNNSDPPSSNFATSTIFLEKYQKIDPNDVINKNENNSINENEKIDIDSNNNNNDNNSNNNNNNNENNTENKNQDPQSYQL
ncbi:expressed protein, partial [Dictyostelium purpureum]